ncbi:MAG: phycobiliprotein lyase [Synechococcus sp.]
MSDPTFPPADPAAFLSLCSGEWMSLRSGFELSTAGDDDWHSSERGTVMVRSAPAEQGELGRLSVEAPGGATTALVFDRDGGLTVEAGSQSQRGLWRFWPDGSVELTLQQSDGLEVQERIWFTRPNLRLRSTTAVDAAGHPVQGSFCTDIRRVSKASA